MPSYMAMILCLAKCFLSQARGPCAVVGALHGTARYLPKRIFILSSEPVETDSAGGRAYSVRLRSRGRPRQSNPRSVVGS